MIVVDTNVIASLLFPTNQQTQAALALLTRDRDWAAPVLWRSEFCNILATGVRNNWLTEQQAVEALANAEALMQGGDYSIPSAAVLQTAIASGCTAYDCEFVVLARELKVALITVDRALLQTFPQIARPLVDGAAS